MALSIEGSGYVEGRVEVSPPDAVTKKGLVETLLTYLVVAAAVVGGLAIVLMMLITVSDVTMRFGFNSPIIGVLEFNSLLVVLAVFGPLGYVQSVGGHIRVDMVASKLPKKVLLGAEVVGFSIVLVLYAMFAWVGAGAAINSFTTGEYLPGIIQFPLWPSRTALVVGVCLIVLIFALNIVQRIRLLTCHEVLTGDLAPEEHTIITKG